MPLITKENVDELLDKQHRTGGQDACANQEIAQLAEARSQRPRRPAKTVPIKVKNKRYRPPE